MRKRVLKILPVLGILNLTVSCADPERNHLGDLNGTGYVAAGGGESSSSSSVPVKLVACQLAYGVCEKLAEADCLSLVGRSLASAVTVCPASSSSGEPGIPDELCLTGYACLSMSPATCDLLAGAPVDVCPANVQTDPSSSSTSSSSVAPKPASSSSGASAPSSSSVKVNYGEPVTYNGKEYPTVQIGDHVWFAKNLNEPISGSWCFEGNLLEGDATTAVTAAEGCEIYGRYYDWSTAMGFAAECNQSNCSDKIKTPHQGICPDGWHIPTNAEWDNLAEAVGGSETAGTQLKSTLDSTAGGWPNKSKSVLSDSHGFSALPAGYAFDLGAGEVIFSFHSGGGGWWSAGEIDGVIADNQAVLDIEESLNNLFTAWDYTVEKDKGLNVRCVQNLVTSL
jgi:uncharacterized protein (TIGR02145 family)